MRTLARRNLVASFALALALVGCGERTGRSRIAHPGRPVRSADGEWTADLLDTGGDFHPTIRDATGKEVWRDDLTHSRRYMPGVAWESEAPVLWVLSSDHGNASVRRDASGRWVKTMGSDGMPTEISDLAG